MTTTSGKRFMYFLFTQVGSNVTFRGVIHTNKNPRNAYNSLSHKDLTFDGMPVFIASRTTMSPEQVKKANDYYAGRRQDWPGNEGFDCPEYTV